jgi:hypothetical protein
LSNNVISCPYIRLKEEWKTVVENWTRDLPNTMQPHDRDARGNEYPIIGVRFPAGERDVYLIHGVQTGSGIHPASYTMDIRTILAQG